MKINNIFSEKEISEMNNFSVGLMEKMDNYVEQLRKIFINESSFEDFKQSIIDKDIVEKASQVAINIIVPGTPKIFLELVESTKSARSMKDLSETIVNYLIRGALCIEEFMENNYLSEKENDALRNLAKSNKCYAEKLSVMIAHSINNIH